MPDAIVAEGLVKQYGKVRALDGLDLAVPEGSVLGLLGPNGAGKTTTVRILTTLLRPDQGRALVGGYDVVEQPDAVRRIMGLSGQYAAVDENLTGRENLDMVGRLYHLGRKAARRRAEELLEQFGLTDAGDRPVRTYSGGMRRRLDLAAALVAKPRILLLDEPTTGLDPRSRLMMWDVIADLVRQGATLLLTTQYLEEADQLADTIAVVDHGRVIARGTADELKTQVGGERLEVVVLDTEGLGRAAKVLARVAGTEARVDEGERRVTVPVSGGAQALVAAVRELDAVDVKIDDIALRRPTLDDVFLALTGHVAEDKQGEEPALAGGRSRR
ncbi:DrrA-related ABC transporter ATP-binding protein [Carbonactinospora thermoautotrophica]|uniref:ATP-binding cassette domain-containing protein n=1 Tax=Carbonactinospora thermoautotrophica TaxID=1469144 RepID=UPI0022715F27|nr:ATP-binding cassette domain-containing protein [Carbonactinospora thermoautotrophica]MCX9191584.1 DrrA-related ABC transporter ATP-binding protein [Carbonactinospora thermoautotrophica]